MHTFKYTINGLLRGKVQTGNDRSDGSENQDNVHDCIISLEIHEGQLLVCGFEVTGDGLKICY